MKKACFLLLLLPTSALAQNYQIKGWGSAQYPAISVETIELKREHHPYFQYVTDWSWMRKSADIEDRRDWQAPVPFAPKIYLKERWWLEPQPNPQLAVKVAVDCPGDPNCPKIPDEAMKKRALQRGYELNGNVMCCGSIDVSQDPIVTGRTIITPSTEFNVLDATPVVPEREKKQHK